VRRRDYYRWPRPANPHYRAIHYILSLGHMNFLEVQIVTQIREAVGILDHSLRLGRIRFPQPASSAWIDDFSKAADALDHRPHRNPILL